MLLFYVSPDRSASATTLGSMTDNPSPKEVERILRERDLYRRILEIGGTDDIEAFLDEVLGLVVELTGAAHGYVQLYGPGGVEAGANWSTSRGCTTEEVDRIRLIISQGIVAAALESGRTIITPSAMLDPRFADRPSIRRSATEAVLCAPVGLDASVGVVYLQSRPGAAPFSESDRAQLELFARHVAPLCDRLLVRQQLLHSEDPTRIWRERMRVESLVGRSRALAVTLKEAAAAAPLRDVTVLLSGESGTGKTHLARLIHENSPRAGGPFVELNAAAMPDTLVESELFGAVRGGHATAQQAMPGKVAAAEGGTLFLDEIGELSLPAQAKLLQLLSAKEYFPIGSARAQRADIRIITATNSDLSEAVADGRFRTDLFHRLDVLRIRMPSLAERREDIPALAQSLCESACARNGLPRIHLSSAAAMAAQVADWPGNVRQLANAVERAMARAASEGAAVAEVRHLFGDGPDGGWSAAAKGDLTWQEATLRFQRDLLARALVDAGGNVTEVSRRLDVARSHVHAKMKVFGLGKPKG
jgi:Nif-specific regulatory protein